VHKTRHFCQKARTFEPHFLTRYHGVQYFCPKKASWVPVENRVLFSIDNSIFSLPEHLISFLVLVWFVLLNL